MIPGINPKKMKQMMKQLGMKMENIDGVERVVVFTKTGQYIFEPAEVVATTMQGAVTYQINGEPRFEAAAVKIPDEDISLVSEQAKVSPEEAEKTLIECKGEVAEAIMKLSVE